MTGSEFNCFSSCLLSCFAKLSKVYPYSTKPEIMQFLKGVWQYCLTVEIVRLQMCWTSIHETSIINNFKPERKGGGGPNISSTNLTFLSLLLPQSKLPPASPLSPLSFPHCLQAPTQRLEQYCEALEELGGINPASDSALSILRHAQRHGEDLRASDLIVGCPVRMPVPVYDSATVNQVPLSFLRGRETNSWWGQAARRKRRKCFPAFVSFIIHYHPWLKKQIYWSLFWIAKLFFRSTMFKNWLKGNLLESKCVTEPHWHFLQFFSPLLEHINYMKSIFIVTYSYQISNCIRKQQFLSVSGHNILVKTVKVWKVLLLRISVFGNLNWKFAQSRSQS